MPPEAKRNRLPIATMAIDVADYLTTFYTAKKHGGYNVYEDDKIRISRDTYVSNLDVYVGVDSITGMKKWLPVYSAAYHSLGRPTIFKSGRWIKHLEVLHEKALAKADEKKRIRQEVEAEDIRQRFEPIDDAKLFPEYANEA